ncbi:MAG: hypothetical protein ACXQS6_03225 [Candidatus Syntropharchaeales archaeon]|nr:hypothetical protein [Candidatus Syntrophoarchaeum sp.]
MEMVCPSCGSKLIEVIEDPEVKLCFKSVKLEGRFYICRNCGKKVD